MKKQTHYLQIRQCDRTQSEPKYDFMFESPLYLLWYETPGFRPWNRCSWKCLELSWGWCPFRLCHGGSPAHQGQTNVMLWCHTSIYIQMLLYCICISFENQHQFSGASLTSMVCVLPDDVCPYAKIVPLYPSRTSVKHQIQHVEEVFNGSILVKI